MHLHLKSSAAVHLHLQGVLAVPEVPNVSEFLNRQPKQLQNSTKQNQTTTKQLLTTLNNPIKVKSA
jgi:hypothetical protein